MANQVKPEFYKLEKLLPNKESKSCLINTLNRLNIFHDT